jgi:predicted transcriptional regulator
LTELYLSGTVDLMDNLRKAFDDNKINIADLAKALETSPSVVYNIKYGRRKVSSARAKRIEKETGGLISRQLLRPDIFMD